MTTSVQRRILVVDHSSDILDSIRSVLEFNGYLAEGTTSSRDALRRLADNTYDLILTDIHMPEMDGLELLQRIKSTVREDLPVILMTGYAEAKHAIEAVRLGAADFLGKPIDTATLLHSVKQQLQKNRNPLAKDYSPRFLASFQINFKFTPSAMPDRNLASVALAYLQKLYDLPSSVYNQLLLCLDEMLQNAFLHGTLGLSPEDRCLPLMDFQKRVDEMLEQPGMQNQYITLNLSLDPIHQVVRMVVTDMGRGFDYQPFLQQSAEAPLTLDGTGRGINFIRLMVDRIIFSNGGRTITIEKSFAL